MVNFCSEISRAAHSQKSFAQVTRFRPFRFSGDPKDRFKALKQYECHDASVRFDPEYYFTGFEI